MYEKILVAVDHSESTPRVLEAAHGLASLSQGEVWVIHLRERETVGKTGLLTSRESAEEADADVSSSVDTLTKAGIKAHGVVRDTLFGHAASEIVAEAKERGVVPDPACAGTGYPAGVWVPASRGGRGGAGI